MAPMGLGLDLSLTNAGQGARLTRAQRYGLISTWSLDEASGTRADGYGPHTLADTGGVSSAVAKLGTGAAQFTAASSQSLQATDTAALSLGDVDWWISLWAYLDSVGADRALATKGTGTAAASVEFTVRFQNSSSRMRLEWGDSTGTASVNLNATAFGAITTATWYHVFAYHDSVNDLIGIGVNNVFNTAATTGKFPNDTAGAFKLGILNTGTFHDGRLDEVEMGKSPSGGIAALVSEIPTFLYNGGTGRAYPWT